MISRTNLAELLSFNPGDYLTTTLYLRIDTSPQQTHLIRLKDLIKQRKKDLDHLNVSSDVAKSVHEDFRKITDFVNHEFSREGARTLIVASCSALKFWKVFTLNIAVPSQITVNSRVLWRPLSLVLDEYSRFLVVLIERAKARLFEVYAGAIIEHSSILDEVPGRVKEGGYAGYDERRIERHIEDHVRRHMKHVADAVFELYNRTACEHILLLGNEQNTNEFHHFLPHPLQERIVASETEEIGAAVHKILEKTEHVEKRMHEEEQRALLKRLFDQVNSDGLGITGLEATLRALAQGQVNYLVLSNGFRQPGFRCTECRSLLVSSKCDYCGGPSRAVSDLVDELIQDAYEQGCQVKYITLGDTALHAAGNVGAMLRFKV